MSELTWYSRLAVLLGSTVLALQSITGRSVGIVTVAAVVATFVGLLAFLTGLVRDGMREAAIHNPSAGIIVHEEDGELVDVGPDRHELQADPALVTAGPARLLRPETERTEEHADGTVTSVASVGSFRVDEVNALELVPCAKCTSPFRVGQIATACPACGTIHHAGCWIDGDFHCAVEGCQGSGSLSAPAKLERPATTSLESGRPRGGPSKP
ncbi:MAG: hypothetical protein NVS2B16_21440 [Chloroflexota bacterium]